MHETFITEGFNQATTTSDLGDMFDQDFLEEELPDTFFEKHLPPGLSQNLDVFINLDNAKHDHSLVEIVTMSDDPEEGYIIHRGPRDVKDPQIYIQPDYGPAYIVFKWYYEQMYSDDYTPFPYVPPVKPSIPGVMLAPGPEIAIFDRFFSDRGALVCYPHYNFSSTSAPEKYVESTDDFMMVGEIHKKMKQYSYRYLFSPKYKFSERIMGMDYDKVWLEFNPFHPLAPCYITEYEDDGRVIKGYHMMGRKEVPFFFDRYDRNYRIHSDCWKSVVPGVYNNMCVYDIVSNIDIAKYLPVMIKGPQEYYKKGRVVEPFYVIDGSFTHPYSPMMGERSESVRGIAYLHYSSYGYSLRSAPTVYYDVSQEVIAFRSIDSMSYEIRLDKNNRLVGSVKGDRVMTREGVFINYELHEYPQVYVDQKMLKEYDLRGVEKYMLLIEDVMLKDMPRGPRGSLCMPLGQVRFSTFFSETKRFSTKFFDAKVEDFLYSEESIDMLHVVPMEVHKYSKQVVDTSEGAPEVIGTNEKFEFRVRDYTIDPVPAHVIGTRVTDVGRSAPHLQAVHEKRYSVRYDYERYIPPRNSDMIELSHIQYDMQTHAIARGAGVGKYSRRGLNERERKSSRQQDDDDEEYERTMRNVDQIMREKKPD